MLNRVCLLPISLSLCFPLVNLFSEDPLAPDLVGVGASGKAPQHSYRFVDHARYLDSWFDALDLASHVTLVVHDWGSALRFYWAQRHPERIKGIAYMEAIVRPLTWQDWDQRSRSILETIRSSAGEVLAETRPSRMTKRAQTEVA